jgi:hypothetical protein
MVGVARAVALVISFAHAEEAILDLKKNAMSKARANALLLFVQNGNRGLTQ